MSFMNQPAGQVPLVATQPAPEGAPCEWCRSAPATVLEEITEPKVVQRGERAGKVTPGTAVRVCPDCAVRIKRNKADQEGATELRRKENGLRRRQERPTLVERRAALSEIAEKADGRGHPLTAQAARQLSREAARWFA